MQHIHMISVLIGVLLGTCASCYVVPASAGTATQPVGHSLHPEVLAVLNDAGIDAAAIHCNSTVYWRPELNTYSKQITSKIARMWSFSPDKKQNKQASKLVLGYLVRSMYEQLKPNNLAVMRLKGVHSEHQGKQKPVLLFRSGIMTDALQPDSCLQSLFDAGGVKHVVNLYVGQFPVHDFIAQEAEAAAQRGVTYHNEADMNRTWRELIEEEPDFSKNFLRAEQQVAHLIKSEILRPKGKPPQGNILIHCGGGIHRTGMIYGIIQRCINGASDEEVEATYKRHSVFKSASEPGGYEKLNLRFILHFNCELL